MKFITQNVCFYSVHDRGGGIILHFRSVVFCRVLYIERFQMLLVCYHFSVIILFIYVKICFKLIRYNLFSFLLGNIYHGYKEQAQMIFSLRKSYLKLDISHLYCLLYRQTERLQPITCTVRLPVQTSYTFLYTCYYGIETME